MTRSRLLFDRTAGSTPFDRDGILSAWAVGETATGGAPPPEQGERWPARRWTGVQGYDAEDLESVFHGTSGLTARFLLVPDWTYLDTQVALLSRGEGGPANSQSRAWEFSLIYRTDEIELWFRYQQTAAASPVAVALGTVGRRPDGNAYWLTFAIDGETVSAWESGGRIASVTIPRPIFATDVQLHLGHRVQHDEAVSQASLRGLLEIVEIEDTATSDVAEGIRYAGLQYARSTVQASWGPFFYQNALYQRRRLRPLEDLLAPILERMDRLMIAHSPPVAYGALLQAWERALAVSVPRQASLAERQVAVRDAALEPPGLTLADLSIYAASLFDVPAVEVTIIERSPSMSVPVTGDDAPPEHWVTDRDVLATAGGLVLSHPAGEAVDDANPTFAYLAIDHVPERALLTYGFEAIGSVTNSVPEHAVTLFWGALWPPAYWLEITDEVVLHEPTGDTTLRTLSGSDVYVRLLWTDAGLSLRVGEPGSPEDDVEIDVEDSIVQVVGFGFTGDGTVPGAPVSSTWSAVQVLDGISGIGRLAHAYHPAPVNRQPVRHSSLLTERSRAAGEVTATYALAFSCDDEDSLLDCTPLALS